MYNNKGLLFFFSLLLLFPLFVGAFSESQLNTLELRRGRDSQLWRTQIRFSIRRNTLLNNSYVDSEGQDQRLGKLLDKDQQDSLLDFSNIYYSFSLKANYSLAGIAKDYGLLKKVDLFVSSSTNTSTFSSPIIGYRNYEAGYGFLDYIHYGLGDFVLGFNAPLYNAKNFLSDFSVALMPYPLSRFSQELHLISSLTGDINWLYFLKTRPKWSVALAGSNSLTLSEYSKNTAYEGAVTNTPIWTSQSLRLIYRQKFNKYLADNSSLSLVHDLGKDLKGHYDQYLTLVLSLRWKIQKSLSLGSAIYWNDRIHVYHPKDPDVALQKPTDWFSKQRTVLSLFLFYSF